jgi:hypothetical protein
MGGKVSRAPYSFAVSPRNFPRVSLSKSNNVRFTEVLAAEFAAGMEK